MQKLILVRGHPGSGKSTLAKSFDKEEFIHLETDMYFIDSEGKYSFDPTMLDEYHTRCQNETDKHLSNGFSVVVSNTFTQKWELKSYFNIAKKHGITPTVIIAQGNFDNVHCVPYSKVQVMKNRFEYDISSLFEE